MLLKKAPKYGNDNEYVDAIAADIIRHYAKNLEQYRDSRGGHFVEVVESQSMNVSQGKCVLASPDGRFAYDPVNDNCSPVMGRDVSGPTACINSVAHLDQKNAKDGCLYNIRFDPRSIQGEKGLQVLGSIVKTYFANMGEHIQINVVDDATLRARSEEPRELPQPPRPRGRLPRLLRRAGFRCSGSPDRPYVPPPRLSRGHRRTDNELHWRYPALLHRGRPRHPYNRVPQGLPARVPLVP